MMRKHLRLRHTDDFARLRKAGTVYRHRWLLLSVAPNERSHNRYGFITSKALGNAVIRNRTRRQLREIIRHLHPHLALGYDMVIIARRPVVGKPFSQILRIVQQLATEASLMVKG